MTAIILFLMVQVSMEVILSTRILENLGTQMCIFILSHQQRTPFLTKVVIAAFPLKKYLGRTCGSASKAIKIPN